MNILLLYPAFPDTFWSMKGAIAFVSKRAVAPPLGLLTVAAMLPAEWNRRLVDLNVRSLTVDDLEWADLAFVSAMVVQRSSAHQLISRCRSAGVTIVAGGPLFTAEHGQFPDVDHFVLNEAEITLSPFLADLERGAPQRIYRSSSFADLHTTPVPQWELAELSRYVTMSVQYSRGCPYNCDFCNVTSLFGRKPRIKRAEQILAELDALLAAGWKGPVFFVDDNLIGNRKHLRDELLPALIEWQKAKRNVPFITQVSINLADDPDLTRQMVDAGFDTVFVGIETPDEHALAECGKTQNEHRDLVADVKRLQRAGLQVQAGFIVGFDSDTNSVFQRQIDFIQRSGIVTAMVGLLQAIPGTRLYSRLHYEGRLTGPVSGDNVDGATNIIPLMPIEALRDGYRRIMQTIYSPGPYYQRMRTFLREYHRPPIRAPLDRTKILALLRSFYRLGILGRERLQYWRMLIWTMLRRPRLLPIAVTLAICGYHYRRVAELHVA